MAANLSATQTRYLALAWLCFDNEPKINYDRFSSLAGLKSAASAREMLRVTKKKLFEHVPTTTDDDASAATTTAMTAKKPVKAATAAAAAAKKKGKKNDGKTVNGGGGGRKRKAPVHEAEGDVQEQEGGRPVKKIKKIKKVKDEPVDEEEGIHDDLVDAEGGDDEEDEGLVV